VLGLGDEPLHEHARASGQKMRTIVFVAAIMSRYDSSGPIKILSTGGQLDSEKDSEPVNRQPPHEGHFKFRKSTCPVSRAKLTAPRAHSQQTRHKARIISSMGPYQGLQGASRCRTELSTKSTTLRDVALK
jgi:hypothetical protein